MALRGLGEGLTDDPATFIQQLGIGVEILACVQLLCEFQVPPCIPLHDAVTYADVVEIVGLPEAQLRAVVRMTSSVGFLSTPRPDYIAHSPLSAKFVTDLGVLDAFGFLSDTLAPCAMKMAEAARRQESPYSSAFGSSSDFADEVQGRWRLQRCATAHSRLAVANDRDFNAERSSLLPWLDWTSLGAATVVDIKGQSNALAVALASEHPALTIVVQSDIESLRGTIPPDLASRIRVETHSSSGQPIQDASVYIVHLDSPTLVQPACKSLIDSVADQLAVLLPILKQNPLARVVLLAQVLTELSPNIPPRNDTAKALTHSLASYRNLALYQLSRGRQHERADVLDCVRHVSDADGVLVVTNEVHPEDDNGLTAYAIQYYVSKGEDKQPMA